MTREQKKHNMTEWGSLVDLSRSGPHAIMHCSNHTQCTKEIGTWGSRSETLLHKIAMLGTE